MVRESCRGTQHESLRKPWPMIVCVVLAGDAAEAEEKNEKREDLVRNISSDSDIDSLDPLKPDAEEEAECRTVTTS